MNNKKQIMKQNNTFQNFILFLLFFLPLFAFSQETIKGTVNQTGTNEAQEQMS